MDTTIAALFAAADRGEAPAAAALFAALYAQLRRVAARELARHGSRDSLSPTTLLHEAYLDMAGREGLHFPDRPRFLGYAARVMRTLIVDHARNRNALKRGGHFEITLLDTDVAHGGVDPGEAKSLAELSDALDELAKLDTSLAEVVDLNFFCGFSFTEIGAMKGLSERTVQRSWDKARVFLRRTLRGESPV